MRILDMQLISGGSLKALFSWSHSSPEGEFRFFDWKVIETEIGKPHVTSPQVKIYDGRGWGFRRTIQIPYPLMSQVSKLALDLYQKKLGEGPGQTE